MENQRVCPRYHGAVELIGRRWNGAILRVMLSGASRFSDIRNSVPGMSDTLLSQRLKELEAEGVIEREVVASTPVRVDYRVTGKGAELLPVLEAIGRWADKWNVDDPCTCDGRAGAKGSGRASSGGGRGARASR